jgi:hypothetical protein
MARWRLDILRSRAEHLCAVEADGEKEAVANAEPGAADILRNMPRRDVAVRAAGAKSDAKWSIENSLEQKNPRALYGRGTIPARSGLMPERGLFNSRRSHGRAVGRPKSDSLDRLNLGAPRSRSTVRPVRFPPRRVSYFKAGQGNGS